MMSVLSQSCPQTMQIIVHSNCESLHVQTNVKLFNVNVDERWFVEIIYFKPNAFDQVKTFHICSKIEASCDTRDLKKFKEYHNIVGDLRYLLFKKCSPAIRYRAFRSSKELAHYVKKSPRALLVKEVFESSHNLKKFCLKNENVVLVILKNVSISFYSEPVYRILNIDAIKKARVSCRDFLVEL
uniref:Uncharacterized protein n=1 Tax=Panagrolaimus sp. JU765 TaxID=591449 RepID=A0AC34Q5A8_9BILA